MTEWSALSAVLLDCPKTAAKLELFRTQVHFGEVTWTSCRRSVLVAASWWSSFNSTGWAFYGQMKRMHSYTLADFSVLILLQ